MNSAVDSGMVGATGVGEKTSEMVEPMVNVVCGGVVTLRLV